MILQSTFSRNLVYNGSQERLNANAKTQQRVTFRAKNIPHIIALGLLYPSVPITHFEILSEVVPFVRYCHILYLYTYKYIHALGHYKWVSCFWSIISPKVVRERGKSETWKHFYYLFLVNLLLDRQCTLQFTRNIPVIKKESIQ